MMPTRRKIYILLALGIAALVVAAGGDNADTGFNAGQGVLCDIGRHFGFCEASGS